MFIMYIYTLLLLTVVDNENMVPRNFYNLVKHDVPGDNKWSLKPFRPSI